MALSFVSNFGVNIRSIIAAALLPHVLLAANAALAVDFRISTKIYVGEAGRREAVPVSESTTLFHAGIVYDFLADGSQSAVFRKMAGKEGRFILLDNDRQVRLEMTTAQLAGAMEGLRNWAAKQSDPMLKFAANPDFKESYDPSTSQLVLASHFQTYTVTTRPVENAEATAEYREFLQWYTQLNTLLHAGPPPEPRLRLNEALARHRVMPEIVELTRAGEKEPIRAVHELTMRLSRDDLEKIDDVRTALASYRIVGNDEFLRASQPGNAAK